MARDIDINEQELAEFIAVLAKFQEIASEQLKTVEADWEKCNESWKGDSKEQFTRDFEKTRFSVESALEAGEDALQWLRNFDEIIREFERNY